MSINYTLFGQVFFFAVFVAFCMKYVWPPIIAALAERSQKIADGLQAAERAGKDLELAQEKATGEIKAAKSQAAEIVDQARKRAYQMIEDAKAKAAEEGQRILSSAEAERDQMIAQAKEELRSKVSVLALAGAEKILESSVDAKAHSDMLDKIAAQL